MPDNPPPPASDPDSSSPNLDGPSATSAELLRGARELIIRHEDQTYRLRLTASNKLILMK